MREELLEGESRGLMAMSVTRVGVAVRFSGGTLRTIYLSIYQRGVPQTQHLVLSSSSEEDSSELIRLLMGRQNLRDQG